MTCDGGVDKSAKGLIRPITPQKFPPIGMIFGSYEDAKATADIYYLHNALPCAVVNLKEVVHRE